MEKFDVAIVGAGSMGSATAYFLSQRGLRVVAFEQHAIVHDLGSHTGSTRIIRHAYFESPDYVPLVMRADKLWLELERQTEKKLLIRTGGLNMGDPSGRLLRDAILSCKKHDLPYEHLSAEEIRNRWPQFRVPDDWEACLDPKMGFLLVDDCIRSYVQAAKTFGTEIRIERVLSFTTSPDGIHIQTESNKYQAGQLIFCAGAWTSKVLRDLELPLTVKRKALGWFRVDDPEPFEHPQFPIFMAEKENGIFYGFPLYVRSGLKIANHNPFGQATNPETVDRNFHQEDAIDLRQFLLRHLPAVSPDLVEGKICLYTLTPDEDFVVDFHPENQNILIAAGFSGHGFKFAPVIGEILADLCVSRATKHQINRFRMSRFFEQDGKN